MQKVYIGLGIAILILATIFAVTNASPVVVKLVGFGEINTSVAMLILVCFASGAALMALANAVRGIMKWKEIKTLKKRLKDSEDIRALLEAQVRQLTLTAKQDKPAE